MILLVHGWGYDAPVWDAVGREIADLPVARVDLGFFGAPTALDDVLPSDQTPLLGVGHSFGFLWLLRHAAPRCRALLSINGFARFIEDDGYPGMPAAALAHMRRRFERDPSSTLTAFWRDCGATPDVSAERADRTTLLGGLDALRDWDERAALASVPDVHALASGNDGIVPPAMSAAAFIGREVEWVDSAGHALLLLEPRLVAGVIRRKYLELA